MIARQDDPLCSAFYRRARASPTAEKPSTMNSSLPSLRPFAGSNGRGIPSSGGRLSAAAAGTQDWEYLYKTVNAERNRLEFENKVIGASFEKLFQKAYAAEVQLKNVRAYAERCSGIYAPNLTDVKELVTLVTNILSILGSNTSDPIISRIPEVVSMVSSCPVHDQRLFAATERLKRKAGDCGFVAATGPKQPPPTFSPNTDGASIDLRWLAAATKDDAWLQMSDRWDACPVDLKWLAVATNDRSWLLNRFVWKRSPTDLRWMSVATYSREWLLLGASDRWQATPAAIKLRAITTQDPSIIRPSLSEAAHLKLEAQIRGDIQSEVASRSVAFTAENYARRGDPELQLTAADLTASPELRKPFSSIRKADSPGANTKDTSAEKLSQFPKEGFLKAAGPPKANSAPPPTGTFTQKAGTVSINGAPGEKAKFAGSPAPKGATSSSISTAAGGPAAGKTVPSPLSKAARSPAGKQEASTSAPSKAGPPSAQGPTGAPAAKAASGAADSGAAGKPYSAPPGGKKAEPCEKAAGSGPPGKTAGGPPPGGPPGKADGGPSGGGPPGKAAAGGPPGKAVGGPPGNAAAAGPPGKTLPSSAPPGKAAGPPESKEGSGGEPPKPTDAKRLSALPRTLGPPKKAVDDAAGEGPPKAGGALPPKGLQPPAAKGAAGPLKTPTKEAGPSGKASDASTQPLPGSSKAAFPPSPAGAPPAKDKAAPPADKAALPLPGGKSLSSVPPSPVNKAGPPAPKEKAAASPSKDSASSPPPPKAAVPPPPKDKTAAPPPAPAKAAAPPPPADKAAPPAPAKAPGPKDKAAAPLTAVPSEEKAASPPPSKPPSPPEVKTTAPPPPSGGGGPPKLPPKPVGAPPPKPAEGKAPLPPKAEARPAKAPLPKAKLPGTPAPKLPPGPPKAKGATRACGAFATGGNSESRAASALRKKLLNQGGLTEADLENVRKSADEMAKLAAATTHVEMKNT